MGLLGFFKTVFGFQYKRRFLIIATCLLISVFYLLFFIYIAPNTNCFHDDEIGIAVMQFSGANLYENFGFTGIEGRIVGDLNQNSKMLGLSEWIKARKYSYEVSTSDHAKRLLNKYNAKGVMWGTISKLDSVASISMNMTYATWGFRLETPLASLNQILVKMERIGPFDVSLYGPEFNEDMNALFNNIYIDLLPYMSMFLFEKQPEFFNSILDTISNMEQYDSLNPLGPYYFFMAAQAEQITKRLNEAIKRYEQSYELCCELTVDRDSNKVYNYSGNINYQTIAAACKFEQGIIRLYLGDTTEAISLMLYSTLLDSSLYNEGLRFASLLETKPESEYTFKIPPCFNYFKASTREDSLKQYYKIQISKRSSR
jgi:tetratricopeptide (TPR) repeat protein